MRGNFSPARNVLSTTAPESRLRRRERTKAPPLPGLTCWNSRIRHTEPSSSMCIPLRNWLVETISAMRARSLVDGHELLWERRQHLRSPLPHGDEVLDPYAAETREVHARLHGDDVSREQRAARRRRSSGLPRAASTPAPTRP